MDLPTVSVLQKLYLTAVGLIGPSADEEVRIRFTNAAEAGALPAASSAPDLVIAAWSLSETPLQLRQSLEPRLRSAESLLINYQERFDSVNNRRYFDDLAASGEWQHIYQGKHAHLPGSYFLYLVR